MSLADIKKKQQQQKPKGLAAIQSKKKKEVPRGLAALLQQQSTQKKSKSLIALKEKRDQAMKLNSKQDFIREGLKFSNCRFVPLDIEPICYGGKTGAFWAVDITNGLETKSFHNRWGAWSSGGRDKDIALPGYTEERSGGIHPAAWIAAALQDRYLRELKALKLPSLSELVKIREEHERQERKKEEERKKLEMLREARRLNKLNKARSKLRKKK